jgi:hypothetical protein
MFDSLCLSYLSAIRQEDIRGFRHSRESREQGQFPTQPGKTGQREGRNSRLGLSLGLASDFDPSRSGLVDGRCRGGRAGAVAAPRIGATRLMGRPRRDLTVGVLGNPSYRAGVCRQIEEHSARTRTSARAGSPIGGRSGTPRWQVVHSGAVFSSPDLAVHRPNRRTVARRAP